MANGVLRSCAAEARAFVVLRKRSRNCSSSCATFSSDGEADFGGCAAMVERSFGISFELSFGPCERSAVELLSDVEAMEKRAHYRGEKRLPSDRGGKLIVCQLPGAVNWKPG